MRRSDREITEGGRIDAAIAGCNCCRLGFYDDGEVYIVPLSFGYVKQGERRILYFHSAKEGRKIDLIIKTRSAGFEMDTNYELVAGETACRHSAKFLSVIGTGSIGIVTDSAEKEAGLQAIMLHNTGKGGWDFSEKELDSVCVLKLKIEKLSCKERR